jgi:hypothetical protein
MLKPLIRYLVPVLFFFLYTVQQVYSQDFIKEYRKYLLGKMAKDGDEKAIVYRRRLINSNVNILKSVLNKTSKKNKQSFCKAHAIYILNSSNVAQEDGGYFIPPSSKLIWNSQKSSCYYETHIDVVDDRPKVTLDTIGVNARNKLSEVDNGLRIIIEKADTSGYINYTKTANLQNPTGLSFTRAVRLKGHWKFVSSHTYIVWPKDSH